MDASEVSLAGVKGEGAMITEGCQRLFCCFSFDPQDIAVHRDRYDITGERCTSRFRYS